MTSEMAQHMRSLQHSSWHRQTETRDPIRRLCTWLTFNILIEKEDVIAYLSRVSFSSIEWVAYFLNLRGEHMSLEMLTYKACRRIEGNSISRPKETWMLARNRTAVDD